MKYQHGPHWLDSETCRFSLWAPDHTDVLFHPVGSEPIPTRNHSNGWHTLDITNPPESIQYYYMAGGNTFPDPCSHFQPEGITGPSSLVYHAARRWKHPRPNHSLNELIIYEVHIGTFSSDGTFDSAIPHLHQIAELGVTAIEVMPIAQWSGRHNWGYDGVFPFAVQNTYGGPEAFARFVDAAHGLGLSVILDVVYNHLGPEGNILPQFGDYFSKTHHTPWGPNLDLTKPQVRNFVFQNVLHWLLNFNIDGLRFDAIQCIHDDSPTHILRTVSNAVKKIERTFGRNIHLIAESDENRMHTVSSEGLGLDAQWNDDFHHSLHARITGETAGYYASYSAPQTFMNAMQHGFYYQGQFNPWRKGKHGSPTTGARPESFVVYSQNHDMVGNRPLGDRNTTRLPAAACLLSAAATILSPFTPMLFMGEEYGETSPFHFFTDYASLGLKRAVTSGRRKEQAGFGWPEMKREGIHKRLISPSSKQAFFQSKLKRQMRETEEGRGYLTFYKRCIALRKNYLPLSSPSLQRQLVVSPVRNVIACGRWSAETKEAHSCWIIMNMQDKAAIFRMGMLPLLPNQPQAAETFSDNWDIILSNGFESEEEQQKTPGELTMQAVATEEITLPPYSLLVIGSKQ